MRPYLSIRSEIKHDIMIIMYYIETFMEVMSKRKRVSFKCYYLYKYKSFE